MRDEIIAKIRALRAKAEDHAATEAEAMAAAEMAARLLVKHDIKPEELAEIAKSEGVVSGFRQGKVLHPVANFTAVAIAHFTETRAYQDNGEIKFIGLEEDVLMAVYLIEMLTGAAKRGWVGHAEQHSYAFREFAFQRESYFRGFATRVSDRLNELYRFRKQQREMAQGSGNSTALVIVKSEVIKRTMDEMGLRLSKSRRNKRSYLDPHTFRAGMAQGNNVNLGRPFGANATTGAIE
jgi:Protein of unknown function (DUF2786)